MGKKCPFLKKPCIEHDCVMYTQLQGTNPNTGQPVDQWNCSLAFLPMLLCEVSQQTRQAGAAIESFRNEMVEQNENLLDLSGSQTITNAISKTRLPKDGHIK